MLIVGHSLNIEINSQILKLVVAKECDTIIKGISGKNKIPFNVMI
jgi:hypothetical protein